MRNPQQKINSRQERFCLEYFFDGNARRAAERAGFSIKNSPNGPQQLLKKPVVIARLEQLQAEEREKYNISNARVLRELCLVAFADMRNYVTKGNVPVDITELDPELGRAVASIKLVNPDQTRRPEHLHCSIKLHDKIRALELLSKILGLFKDQTAEKDYVRQIIVVPSSMDDETVNRYATDIKEGNIPPDCTVISPLDPPEEPAK